MESEFIRISAKITINTKQRGPVSSKTSSLTGCKGLNKKPSTLQVDFICSLTTIWCILIRSLQIPAMVAGASSARGFRRTLTVKSTVYTMQGWPRRKCDLLYSRIQNCQEQLFLNAILTLSFCWKKTPKWTTDSKNSLMILNVNLKKKITEHRTAYSPPPISSSTQKPE